MIENKDKDKVQAGTKMRCIAAHDYYQLTEGKVYSCMYGLEEGVFETRPYVSVIGNHGKPLSCHASRFELAEE
jgi:HKD family nuclease